MIPYFKSRLRLLVIGLTTIGLTAAVFSSPAMADEEDEREMKAEHHYNRAIRFAQRGKNESAFKEFEKAIPYMNEDPDLYYNLVTFGFERREWSKVALYGAGYLFMSEDPEETKEVARKVQSSHKYLRKYKGSVEKVSFKLEPKGTTVFVNHVPVARAGKGYAMLPVDTYTATAKEEDYQPWSRKFEIKVGESVTVRGKMKPIVYHGMLKIVTEPAEGVQVLIDGKKFGLTPLDKPIKLQTRRYLVRFEKKGYDFWHRYVDIEREETHELSPVMEVEGYVPPED